MHVDTLLSRASLGPAEDLDPNLPRLITDTYLSAKFVSDYEATQDISNDRDRLDAIEQLLDELTYRRINFVIIDQEGGERVIFTGGPLAGGKSVLVFSWKEDPLIWPDEQTKHSDICWSGLFDYITTYGVITVSP